MENLFQCPKCGNALAPRCFYCGELTKDSVVAVETHIMQCEKHPMAALRRQVDKAQQKTQVCTEMLTALAELVDSMTTCEGVREAFAEKYPVFEDYFLPAQEEATDETDTA